MNRDEIPPHLSPPNHMNSIPPHLSNTVTAQYTPCHLCTVPPHLSFPCHTCFYVSSPHLFPPHLLCTVSLHLLLPHMTTTCNLRRETPVWTIQETFLLYLTSGWCASVRHTCNTIRQVLRILTYLLPVAHLYNIA